MGFALVGTAGSGEIAALTARIAALQSQLAALGSVKIFVVSPVTEGGSISLTRGDSYLAADGRALSWSSSAWPNLDGRTVRLLAVNRRGGEVGISVPCTVTSATVDGILTQTVVAELTSTTTAALDCGECAYEFAIAATASDVDRVTLVAGMVTVIADPREGEPRSG